MNVIIVDDEPAARRTLRECCARHPDLIVVAELGDTASALAAIRARPPDLLFLDIQIDAQDGIALARSLDSAPLIVFVTAHDTYALQAFEVSAVDYLLKPFDEERFETTLSRVRRRHEAQSLADRQRALSCALEQIERSARSLAERRPRVLAESGSRMHLIDVADVEIVEADRNYVSIRAGREVFHARSTLQQAAVSLQSQPMLRISRSCLVNVAHISQISRTPRGDFILVMAGGATVTSSEGFREAVRQYFKTLKLAPAQG